MEFAVEVRRSRCPGISYVLVVVLVSELPVLQRTGTMSRKGQDGGLGLAEDT
jgi:hypothetical protein